MKKIKKALFAVILLAVLGMTIAPISAQINSWSSDIRLTDDPAYSKYPSIAVDSNDNIHIAFYDKRGGTYEIYYTKLDNDGNTLVDDTKLTTDPAISSRPSIAVDINDNIHIAWHDKRDGNYEIYYTKLDNNGATLVDDTRLTDYPGDSMYSSIAVDSSGNVHIAWRDRRDGGSHKIYYTKLDNNGATLIDDTMLTPGGFHTDYPKTAVDSSGNVHIAWGDNRDGNYEIYYTKLDNDGATLVDDTRLTDDPALSSYPTIAVDYNNNIHIAWSDFRDETLEIYYTKLDNVGTTLVDDTRLTDDPARSAYPSIVVDSSGNVHIAWEDERDGNREIYYTDLDNNGNTVVDDTRLTDAPENSWKSSIAVDSSNDIHITWYDKRDGNDEIYYKKGCVPDLTPTAITTPASIFAAQSNSIEATIANIGSGNASSFNVSLSADGTPVDTASVDSLSGGASMTVSFSWTPDSAGGYELCVIADSDGAVDESDETNNGLCEGVTVERPVIPVDIDVKPGSCPNPLNQKSKGVLPVAVLGTAEFDVTTIDPGTILLTREGCEGVAAQIRWSYEDVATPFTGELCDCHDLNGDGYMDLTLKFDTQELVSNLKLDEVAGETIPLAVTGDLKAENGGTPIEGKDCIRVL